MLAILISLNAHNLPIFRPILVILVSKFMVNRVRSNNTYFTLGLLSPLKLNFQIASKCNLTPKLVAVELSLIM